VRAAGLLATGALAFTLVLALLPACRKVTHAPAPDGHMAELARIALDHLPDGSPVLVGLSWTQVRESPFWKAIAPKLLAADDVKQVLDNVKSVCGIDLIADFDSVVLSMPVDLDDANMVALVKGRWDEDKIGNCIAATSKQRGEDEALTFSKENGVSVLQNAGEKIYLAWVAPDTFLYSASASDDSSRLEQLVHPRKPLSSNQLVMSLLQRVDAGDAVWMIAANPGQIAAFKSEDAKSVKGLYGSLELGEKAHGYLGMRFDTPDRAEIEARGGEDFLAEQKGKPQLKELLHDSRVFVAGYDVVVEARVSETKVAELAERLSKMSDGEWLLVLSSLEKLMGGK